MGKNTLDFDSRDFLKRLNLYDKKQNAAARKALLENSLDLEKNAMATSPKELGDLEGDIKASKKIKDMGGSMETEVAAGKGLSRNYAVRMHESLLPAIPTGDRQFRPGEITTSKPSNPWGEAGGKYLTRPLMFKMTEYTKNIAKKIKAVK